MNPCMFMIVPFSISFSFPLSAWERGCPVSVNSVASCSSHLPLRSSVPMKNRLAQEKIPDDTADQLPGRHTPPMGFTFQGSCLATRQKHGQFHHLLVDDPQALCVQARDQRAALAVHGEHPLGWCRL